ncbi:hypothetical protein, partial [Enterobacter hormaechei]
ALGMFYSVRAGGRPPGPTPRATVKKKKKPPQRGFCFYNTRIPGRTIIKSRAGYIKNITTTTCLLYKKQPAHHPV